MAMLDARGRSIDDSESALLAAMRASDVEALDALIADGLVFTMPDGSTIDKQTDLESHRSGRTRFLRLDELSRRILEADHGGTTELTAEVDLIDDGRHVSATLTWRRLWTIEDGRWQVVEGSVRPA